MPPKDAPSNPDVVEARKAWGPRRELMKDELIDKAAELFSVRSYSNTSLTDIANELGLQRSSIYYYFKNKREILEALVMNEAERPVSTISKLLDDSSMSSTERLRQTIVNGIIHRVTTGDRIHVLQRIELEMPKDLRAVYNRRKREILTLYSRLIQSGIDDGSFRNLDVSVAAFAVIGMINWTASWYTPSDKLSPREIGDRVADFAIRGLVRTDGSADGESALSLMRIVWNDVNVLESLTQ